MALDNALDFVPLLDRGGILSQHGSNYLGCLQNFPTGPSPQWEIKSVPCAKALLLQHTSSDSIMKLRAPGLLENTAQNFPKFRMSTCHHCVFGLHHQVQNDIGLGWVPQDYSVP